MANHRQDGVGGRGGGVDRETVLICSSRQDFLKGFPYSPPKHVSSFGCSRMSPVASCYPAVAGFVIQLHASITSCEGGEKEELCTKEH